jgi:hypothetical protein
VRLLAVYTKILQIILSVFYFFDLVAVWLGDLASVVSGWLWLTMESPQQTQKIRQKINREQDNCFTSVKKCLEECLIEIQR